MIFSKEKRGPFRVSNVYEYANSKMIEAIDFIKESTMLVNTILTGMKDSNNRPFNVNQEGHFAEYYKTLFKDL